MTEPSTDDAPPDDLAALIRRQDAALERHRAGDTAEQIADRLGAYGYAGMPPGYARAAVKADLQAAVAREDGRDHTPMARMLQVIQANFGDRLIIRVPGGSTEEQMRTTLASLHELNPGARFLIFGCDADVLPDTDFIDQVAAVMGPAYASAAGAEADADALRAAVEAMLQWIATPAQPPAQTAEEAAQYG